MYVCVCVCEGGGGKSAVLAFTDFRWVFDNLDFKVVLTVWILNRELWLGVRAQFCDLRIFRLIPTQNDLSRY